MFRRRPGAPMNSGTMDLVPFGSLTRMRRAKRALSSQKVRSYCVISITAGQTGRDVDGQDEVPVGPSDSSVAGELSDEFLIGQVRAGDSDAYGVLYERHRGAAQSLARQLSRDSSEADDLVSDAFLKVRSVLDDGRGPDAAFRAYLLTTVRRLAYDRTRSGRRLVSTSDYAGLDTAVPFRDTTASALEASMASDAFNTLPERWRLVLWHRVVLGHSTEQVARELGTTPSAVAALLYRAREGLREAYLQAHITQQPQSVDCDWTIERLAAYARGGLPKRESARVRSHLDECERCRTLNNEVREVNATLRAAMAPALLGSSAALLTSSATVGGSSLTGASAGAGVTKLMLVGLALGGTLTVATGSTLYLLNSDSPAPGAEYSTTHAVLSAEELSRLAELCSRPGYGAGSSGPRGEAGPGIVGVPSRETPVALGPDGTTVASLVADGASAMLVDVTAARLLSQPCVAISSAQGATFLSFGSQTERPWRCSTQATTILCRPEGRWWRSADSDPAGEFDLFVSTRTSATDDRSPMVYVITQTRGGYSVEPVDS